MTSNVFVWLIRVIAALVAVVLIAGTVWIMETVFGWSLDRSVELIVALLGIVLGGAIIKPVGDALSKRAIK